MTKIPHLRWFVVLTLFVASGLSFFDRQVLSVLAPIITKDLRMDNIAYSWVVFAFILAYSVMFSAGGRIIDRLGTRGGLGLAVGVWSVASLLHSVAHSALQLGFFRFLLGFGEGGCFPGAAKGVMEWFPKRERATAMGIATSGGSAFGAVVAPPVVAWAAVHLGWRGAFLITGFLGAGWVVVWVSTYSRPQESRLLSDRERSYLAQTDKGLFEPAGSKEIARPVPWAALLRLRQVQGLVGSRLLFDSVFYFYMFWIPQYLSQVRGASLEKIGQLSWIPFLTLGVASVLGGLVSDRLVARGWAIDKARKGILRASAFLTPVSILVVYVRQTETAILLMSVLMFAHGFWITNYMTIIGDLFPSRMVATVVGLTGTAGGIGGFLTSLLIGRVVQHISFTPVFVAAGVTYPICLVIMVRAIKEIKPIDFPFPSLAGSSRVPS
ncbi:MAG: MFS transporter [Terriglobia bacterium]|jgi:ACS family hexuronate transporter-like MFS transporter